MLFLRRSNFAPVLITAAVLLPLVTQASEDELAKLHNVLKSNASIHEKGVACERLAVIGNRDSIPILAELLADDRLAHYARFGLEAIPDATVDRVFRSALGQLKGQKLVGVINSIGVRKDSEAVAPLSDLMLHADPQVAAAAAAALGQIASDQAVTVLLQSLSGQGNAPAPAVGDASLACARILLAKKQQSRALEVYDAVRQSDLPKHLRVAATYSAIDARGPSALPLLQEQLQGDDDAFFAIALQAARGLANDGVSKALVAALSQKDPQRQAMLIIALGDLGDMDALPAVREAANVESPVVRRAAMKALGKIGDRSVVETLLNAAVSPDGATARAARESLERLPDPAVDAVIVEQLAKQDPERFELLIALAGSRRILAAVPDLWSAAESPLQPIRLAAVKALGETVGAADLDKLMSKVVTATSADERSAAAEALTAACIRIPDREGTVEQVSERFAQASAEMQSLLFALLREVGGTGALRQVLAGARDGREAVQDAATRELGEWLTADVAPDLLELAQSLESNKYQIRALRGYIRVIRQFGLPDDQRMAMSRRALSVAKRDDEKILVLQALTRFPSTKSLALAIEQLTEPQLKIPAAQVAVVIAEQLDASQRDPMTQAMERVLQSGIDQPLADRARGVLNKIAASATSDTSR